MSKKPEPTPVGAAKWNAATTVDELKEAVADIDAEISGLAARKAELETDPGEFVLAGGDLAARAREAGEITYRIAAFESARATIAGRLETAQRKHFRDLAERDLATAFAMEPTFRAACQRFHAALVEVMAASEEIGEIARNIDATLTRPTQIGMPKERLPHLLRWRVEEAAEFPKPVRGLHDRHKSGADNLEVLAGQAAAIIEARAEATSGALHPRNAELLSRTMTREASVAASARRAALPAPAAA